LFRKSRYRKRRQDKQPKNKRLKNTEKEEPTNKIEQTSLWDPPLPNQGDKEKLFAFLLGETTQQQFFSKYWQETHLFISSRGTAHLKNYGLIPLNIKNFL